jgi:hypothetical protein
MKKTFIAICFFSMANAGLGQESRFTLSGGWSSANIEDADVNADGWRINGLYEYVPYHSKFAHGFSFGYIGVSADKTSGSAVTTYDISTVPLYYAPKFSFGKEKLNGFIKGALGAQFSSFKRTGSLGYLKSNDFGFAGGGGAGITIFFKGNLFLTGEYELLWVSNSFYRDGLLNNALIGLGIRFK